MIDKYKVLIKKNTIQSGGMEDKDEKLIIPFEKMRIDLTDADPTKVVIPTEKTVEKLIKESIVGIPKNRVGTITIPQVAGDTLLILLQKVDTEIENYNAGKELILDDGTTYDKTKAVDGDFVRFNSSGTINFVPEEAFILADKTMELYSNTNILQSQIRVLDRAIVKNKDDIKEIKDTELPLKANKADVYAKSETYTQTEVDSTQAAQDNRLIHLETEVSNLQKPGIQIRKGKWELKNANITPKNNPNSTDMNAIFDIPTTDDDATNVVRKQGDKLTFEVEGTAGQGIGTFNYTFDIFAKTGTIIPEILEVIDNTSKNKKEVLYAKFDYSTNELSLGRIEGDLIDFSTLKINIVEQEIFVASDGLLTKTGASSTYQTKTDTALSTTTKSVVGAINELSSGKQDKADTNLETADKTIVGAINEIKDKGVVKISTIAEKDIFAAAPKVGDRVTAVIDDPIGDGSKDVYEFTNMEKLTNQAIYDVHKTNFSGSKHITERFFTECNETNTADATMGPLSALDDSASGNEEVLWKSVKDRLVKPETQFTSGQDDSDSRNRVVASPDKTVLWDFIVRDDGELALQGSGKIGGVPVQLGFGTFNTGAGDKEVALLYTTIVNGQPKQNFIPLSDIHNPGLGVAISKDNERFREGVTEEFYKEILNAPGEAKEMWTRNPDGTYTINNDWQTNGSLLGSAFLDIKLLNDAIKVSSAVSGGTPDKVYIDGKSISVSTNPTKAMNIATKHYVDSHINPSTGKLKSILDKTLLKETKNIDVGITTTVTGQKVLEDTTTPYTGTGDYSDTNIIAYEVEGKYTSKNGDLYDEIFTPEYKKESGLWKCSNGQLIPLTAYFKGKIVSDATLDFGTADINLGLKETYQNFGQGTSLPDGTDGGEWSFKILSVRLIQEGANVGGSIDGLSVTTDPNTGASKLTFTEPDNTSNFEISLTDNKISSMKMNAKGSTFEVASDANGKFDIKSTGLTINGNDFVNMEVTFDDDTTKTVKVLD